MFVDGWSVEAATEVGGVYEDETLDLLDALARQSLIRVDATDHGPRFSMLETVRELATERLAELYGSLEQAQERARIDVAAGRLGTVEEMSGVAAFLCSERASYVTGAAIRVDGGLTRSV